MDSARRYTYKAGTTVLGGQDVINLDPFARQIFHASFHVDVVSGTVAALPEYTMGDVNGDPALLRWHTYTAAVPTEPALIDETKLIALDRAVTAVRLNILMLTGEIRLTVLQGVGR